MQPVSGEDAVADAAVELLREARRRLVETLDSPLLWAAMQQSFARWSGANWLEGVQRATLAGGQPGRSDQMSVSLYGAFPRWMGKEHAQLVAEWLMSFFDGVVVGLVVMETRCFRQNDGSMVAYAVVMCEGDFPEMEGALPLVTRALPTDWSTGRICPCRRTSRPP